MARLSAHFDTSEFVCRHCGRLPASGIDPKLVALLERLRAGDDRPLPIVSGYRCPTHNRNVGGTPHSLHLIGRAADIPSGRFTVAQAVAAGAGGVGYCGRWVVHVDTRRVHRAVIFGDC